MYYIYMVRCADDSIYTGIAADLQRRMREHAEKAPAAAKYTRSRQVVGLEAVWTAADRAAASRLEYAVKQLPRQKKLELIAAPVRMDELLPKLRAEDYTHLPGVTLEDCLKGELPCV